MKLPRLILAILPALPALHPLAAQTEAKAGAAHRFSVPDTTAVLLDTYCTTCHDEESHKGDVRLDILAELDTPRRLDLLNRMQEQLHLKHMPPEKKKQPTAEERKALLEFAAAGLAPHRASTLEDKLRKPEFGNYVDHDALFSGENAGLPGFTPDRRWLISEYIFNAKFQRMLGNETFDKKGAQRVAVLGGVKIQNLNLTNPFLLPNISGVRYYANEDFTGGHLSSMLTNAQKTAEYITGDLLKRRGNKLFPAITEIMALDNRQQAAMESRRAYLEKNIAALCAEIYGPKNNALLPVFKPVELKPLKALAEGEVYKKAPIHVALNMIEDLGAKEVVFQALLDPELSQKSDNEIRIYCEKVWFNHGDHERVIQGRMGILREYLPELRQHAQKEGRKLKAAAVKPLDAAELAVVRASVLKNRQQGDFYSAIIAKCAAEWEKQFEQERIAAGPPSDKLILDLVGQVFERVLERSPTREEAAEHLGLTRSYMGKLGKLKAIQKLIQTCILSSEFSYRQEFGAGTADAHGRRLLAPRDASYAIAYALTDQSPDAELARAAASGRLNTREDYRREVTRILAQRDVHYLIDPILADTGYNSNTTNLAIRKLRFFREFFGYPAALTIFKDEKRFGGDRLGDATHRLINETDRLVQHILEKKKNVFEELLTTEEFIVYHDGDNARMQAASDRIKSIYAYFKDLKWKSFRNEDLVAHGEFLRKVKMRSVDPDHLDKGNRQGTPLQLFKLSLESITARLNKGQKEAAPFDLYRGYGYDFMDGYHVSKFFNIPLDNWDYATVQPAKLPNRKGLLTHPAWLIAHAKNTETDPVHRGKWVREKLLAGTIPDVPISVDAQIPEDHNRTLRDRLASATETAYCWRCHEKMNPLGYVFESYDDFGRFRLEEQLEYPDKLVKKGPDKPPLLGDSRDLYKTLPVNSSGVLQGTGDPALDGVLRDASDLATRLAKSQRVRQSIIRHAFRYFLGRNETLSDSKTLIDADQAYLKSGGDFDAVIISLLTSDSFIYRKPLTNN